jgi:hypothetical protein
LAVLAVVALARGEAVQEKRGVVAGQQAYTSQQTYAAPAPASIAYTKVQQPVQKAVVAPQPQFYSQQAAAPAAYAVPTVQQQYQYQPQAQAVAYAQPGLAKYAAAPADAAKLQVAAYRPQFSLANDVSSFTYSSPVVTYNNLGLLSQVVGKIANPGQAKVAAAPAPVAYQAQAQKVAYPQPSPVAYAAPAQLQQAKYALQAQQPQRLVAAAPQQYFSQVPQQAYAAAPQAAYQQAQAQAYTSQSVPQSLYSQAPQYYNAAQQAKQVNPGVSYAQ